MKKHNYKQLATILNKDWIYVREIASKLQIPKTYRKGLAYVDDGGLKTLQDYFSPKTKSKYKHDKIKISVIERYFYSNSINDVARTYKLGTRTVSKIIKECEETGHIIVSSSINNSECIAKICVYKRYNKWQYKFTRNKITYYKDGFEDEDSAVEAMLRLKEKLRIDAR
ncbi:MAG TPA: hypothetical protein VLA48_02590 [Nitrososphaeraceae archaeon]|nr:hypothetical protein [Nitrososphaeraceae archaeon]